jgi:hypothetical protein
MLFNRAVVAQNKPPEETGHATIPWLILLGWEQFFL